MTTATKSAEEARSAADREMEEARERQARINEIDATFREEVKAAADRRAKALADLPGYSTNFAETAWNETKAEDDPLYADVSPDFRRKLDTAVDSIRNTGSADIVGLEAFEARVKELIAEEKEEKEPTAVATKSTSEKSGKLPEDFPHRAELEAAGITTYAQARKLNGDYSSVPGVGTAKGKEIDAAL